MSQIRKQVLILDDEERIRHLLECFFEDYDEFDMRFAESGEEALDELATLRADLCIVDMRLPGMNGREFIMAAKARDLGDFFLLHTGSMDFHITEELTVLGITSEDVFFKPCNMNDMLLRMRALLNV